MEQYMEHMVKKQTTMGDKAIRIICILLVVLLAGGGFLIPLLWFAAIIFFVIYRYLIYPMTDLEFEYLYVDRTLTVDKIMAKEKRKTIATYELDRMELLVPANSYRLAEYRDKDMKTVGFWSLDTSDDHVPYAMIYEGGLKVLLDLPKDFVKIIQNNAPRKVFFD